MFKILLMISNYFHDLATAIMFSNILVVYFLGLFLDNNPNKQDNISRVFSRLSYVTYSAFVYIILAGIVRAYYFMDFEWNPAVGKGQVAALIVKHIFLFSMTAFGVVIHLRYQKRYGKK